MSGNHTNNMSNSGLACTDVEDLLDCYIDREMSEALRSRFEAHLLCCEECRSLVDDVSSIVEAAKSLAFTPLPDRVAHRLREALKDNTGLEFSQRKPHLSLLKTS